jgi:hypothetical protein
MPDNAVSMLPSSTVPVSTVPASTAPVRWRPAVFVGAGLAGLLVAGTIRLWAHYGGTVFFEMIMAGLAACF